MTNGITLRSIGTTAALAGGLALVVFAGPVRAADPVFPTGSLVGLVPPAGMVVSKSFLGFEDVDKDSAIQVATQPAAAFSDIQKTLVADSLKKQGITVDKREDIQLSFGKGTLVIGKQEADKKHYRKWLLVAPTSDFTVLVNAQIPEEESAYSDAAVHAALATLAVRASIPDPEKLSLVPFTIGDLSGFHIENVLPGRALMLIDTPDGKPTSSIDTHLFIAAFPGGPDEASNRAEFARLAFGDIVGIRDVQIAMSEPLRIGGQAGFQTLAQAKDAHTGADIMVAQWLRFGSGGFLQMIGIARTEAWTDALTRLRAIRDSIDLK
jgi:hypothetical protein